MVFTVPFDIIGSFTFLVELTLYLEFDRYEYSPPYPNPQFRPPYFQSLRSLSLTASSDLINSMLTMFSFIPLESIAIKINSYGSNDKTAHHIANWVTTIRKIGQWANTLLHIKLDQDWKQQVVIQHLSPFEPLLLCLHLRHLSVRSPLLEPIFSNDDIVKMATAWPQLRELHFDGLCSRLCPTADITSLAFLAEKLPHLRVLNLPFNLSFLPPTVVPHVHHQIGQRLLKLHIERFFLGDSDPVLVAAHLDNLFPWTMVVLNDEQYFEPQKKLEAILLLRNTSSSPGTGYHHYYDAQ